MRTRNSGYSSATSRAMAMKTVKRENARRWFFEEGLPKTEIMGRLGITRTTLNVYLRDKASISRFKGS